GRPRRRARGPGAARATPESRRPPRTGAAPHRGGAQRADPRLCAGGGARARSVRRPQRGGARAAARAAATRRRPARAGARCPRGEPRPAVSPRAPEVRYLSHHAFALISGSVIAAIAIGALVLILLLLVDAARFRRPETWSAARPLVLAGGISLALVSVAHQVVGSIEAHKFAV